ncbi:MAG: hypothetical protein K2N09_00850 [Muribaculaceae bacterium]|nr:hypothetical protein [Muribaculaceae bacterium]
MRLLIFNPETEYALASGASFYTPPARVERLRRELQLLPEVWAAPGDRILVDDTESLSSCFPLVTWGELASLFKEFPDIVIEPWGWNPALVRRFLDSGVPSEYLPDTETIARIRALAHRRTTIALNNLWNETVDSGFRVDVPSELHSIEECMFYYKANPGCWMKAPWSSSGRGVINTAADMNDMLVEQWCRGILRRQGSVMGETGAVRKADYATEWRMSSGELYFIGLSSFSTSNRGKYISNDPISQVDMKERFNAISLIPIDEVVANQKVILQEILKGYDGLFGVDMIIQHDGRIRPFVELNLRRTMGMLHCKGC